MFKRIYLVYQDCVECEPAASRLAGDYAVAGEAGVEIEKMPFFKKGAPELIKKAAKAGVTLPFFSDGEKCAKHLVELVRGKQETAEDEEAPVKAKKKKG